MFTLTCQAGDLARALTLAAQTAGKEKQIPILRAVRIDVSDKFAIISATNNDHGVATRIAAEGEGIAHIDLSLILPKAQVMRQNQPVTITSEDGKFIEMKQGRTKLTATVLDGDAFPVDMTKALDGSPVTLTAGPLLAALSVAPDAIDPGISRSVDMGALVDSADGRFRIVSGNGKVFMVTEIDLPAMEIKEFILPHAAISSICSLFRESDALQVVATENAVSISTDTLTYRTKLVEDRYPDWRAAVSRQAGDNLDAVAIVSRVEFVDAIKRAGAIGEDSNKQNGSFVPIRGHVGGGELTLTAKNSRGEEGEDAIACEGPEGSFGVNAIALKRMTENLGSGSVRIRYSSKDPAQPIVVHAEPSDRDNYRVIMPVRMVW